MDGSIQSFHPMQMDGSAYVTEIHVGIQIGYGCFGTRRNSKNDHLGSAIYTHMLTHNILIIILIYHSYTGISIK